MQKIGYQGYLSKLILSKPSTYPFKNTGKIPCPKFKHNIFLKILPPIFSTELNKLYSNVVVEIVFVLLKKISKKFIRLFANSK